MLKSYEKLSVPAHADDKIKGEKVRRLNCIETRRLGQRGIFIHGTLGSHIICFFIPISDMRTIITNRQINDGRRVEFTSDEMYNLLSRGSK